MSVRNKFTRYVSLNILGMIGISMYVLADTFFISRSTGADGITALNLVLPIYNLLFAIGSMIGVGSAIRFSISASSGNGDTKDYFMNALFWGLIIGVIFSCIGIFFTEQVMKIMGADSQIVKVGLSYTKIFMAFSPFFIVQYVFTSFVRNDNSPHIAMLATLISSLFNIIFDYILIFPVGMGMSGAALATALSPIVGILINSTHFLLKRNTISLKLAKPSVVKMLHCIKVGVSAFVGEISSGVITVLFNMLILNLVGNVGVAAYGIIANIALVPVAMYNGISLGIQPLLSDYYGRGDNKSVNKIRNLGFMLAVVLGIVIIAAVYMFTPQLSGIFNKDNDSVLASIANKGMRIYVIGFLAAGINVVTASYFSSINEPIWAFVQSIVKGIIGITVCAVVLSWLFGIIGVWIAFPIAELITLVISLEGIRICNKKYK